MKHNWFPKTPVICFLPSTFRLRNLFCVFPSAISTVILTKRLDLNTNIIFKYLWSGCKICSSTNLQILDVSCLKWAIWSNAKEIADFHNQWISINARWDTKHSLKAGAYQADEEALRCDHHCSEKYPYPASSLKQQITVYKNKNTRGAAALYAWKKEAWEFHAHKVTLPELTDKAWLLPLPAKPQVPTGIWESPVALKWECSATSRHTDNRDKRKSSRSKEKGKKKKNLSSWIVPKGNEITICFRFQPQTTDK